jgi:hypothetical protein
LARARGGASDRQTEGSGEGMGDVEDGWDGAEAAKAAKGRAKAGVPLTPNMYINR